MDPLYVGFDIHEKTLTGTAMDKQGIVEFSGTIRNTREAVQCFLSGIPSPHVRIAIEACGLWRGGVHHVDSAGVSGGISTANESPAWPDPVDCPWTPAGAVQSHHQLIDHPTSQVKCTCLPVSSRHADRAYFLTPILETLSALLSIRVL
jgi:Ni,Fe-hydrogenase III small subunit